MHIHTHEMIASDMPLTTHRIRRRKGSYIHLEASMAARNRYYYSNHGNLFRYRPKAIERPLQNLKTGPKELAQTPLMRQLSEPFLAEGGIRLPRYRVMWQQPLFAQARCFLSIEAIKSDAISLAVVKEGGDCHLSGRSEKVCELRICLCPVIAGVNGTDGMEELASRFSKIRQCHAGFNPFAISVCEVDSSSYNLFSQTRHFVKCCFLTFIPRPLSHYDCRFCRIGPWLNCRIDYAERLGVVVDVWFRIMCGESKPFYILTLSVNDNAETRLEQAL